MDRLIATRQVLYMGSTYERGEALPSDNPAMADAWLRAGSARREIPAPPPVDVAETCDYQGEADIPDTLDVIDSHITVRSLMKMDKSRLMSLAGDMGLEVTDGMTKKNIAELIASAEVIPEERSAE